MEQWRFITPRLGRGEMGGKERLKLLDNRSLSLRDVDNLADVLWI